MLSFVSDHTPRESDPLAFPHKLLPRFVPRLQRVQCNRHRQIFDFFRQDIVGHVLAGFVYGHHHASVSGMPRMSLTSGARSSTGRLDNTP